MIILLPVLLGALIVFAMKKPEVLESRLVRAGAIAVFVSSGLLLFLPAMVTGLLFFVAVPVGLLLIVVGTVLSLTQSDKRMNADVAALAVAAKRTGRLWPDDAPLPQVDEVVKHGMHAGPALVALLRFESEEQFSDPLWSPSVEQQSELALCRIYGEAAKGARTVYDIRATTAENRQVKQFWDARVRSAGGNSARGPH
jgi:hypothetical protein